MAAPQGGFFFLKLKIQKQRGCLFVLISVSNCIDEYRKLQFGVLTAFRLSLSIAWCLSICVFSSLSGTTRGELQSMRPISSVINVVRFSCHA